MEYTLIDYIKNIQKDAIVSMIVDNISCLNTDKVQNGFIVAIANTPTGIKKTMLEELVYNKIKDNKASAFSSGLAVGAVSTKLQDYILEVSVYLLAGGYESDPLSAESEAFHDQCGVVANYFGVDEDMEDEVH